MMGGSVCWFAVAKGGTVCWFIFIGKERLCFLLLVRGFKLIQLVDGETLPLVLTPPEPSKNGIESLLETLKNNKEWFDDMVTKNSAVLLRGFDVKNAVEFNDIVEAFDWEDGFVLV